MKFLKTVSLYTILASSYAFGCAGGNEEMYVKDEYYNFLNPSMVGLSEDNPFYYVANYYPHNDRWEYYDKQKEKLNLEAWQKYFDHKLSANETKELFYGQEPIKKSYAKVSAKINNPDVQDYINFLTLQMPYVVKDYEKPLAKGYKPIVEKGLKLFSICEDKFLKERYLFLIMRLYHYHGEYQNELAFYEKNKQFLTPNPLVKEWVEALRAGAMQHLNQSVESNKLYATIFQNNKTNGHLGYYDFKVKNDNEWKNLLLSVTSADDKARFYFIRALKWENTPLKEFESIATFAPLSIWFERLSYMIMQDLQNQRYALMSNSNTQDKHYKEALQSYKEQEAYYQKILNGLQKPSFFSVYAQLYLDAISYRPLNSEKLEQMKRLSSSSDKKYVNLIAYLHQLKALKSVDISAQESVYRSLKPLMNSLPKKQQTSILRYTALQIASLYPQESIERTLAKDYANQYSNLMSDLFTYGDPYKLSTYLNLQNRSFLEHEIYQKYTNEENKNQVLATLYVQNNDFSSALKALVQARGESKKSEFNPFNATISGNNRTGKSSSMSQEKFATIMNELQAKIKDSTATAQEHYLYATGLYNKSWFGNFPISGVSHRSVYFSPKDMKILNLAEAKKEYLIALNSSSDREFKATVAYQLLKIDYNEHMVKSLKKEPYEGYEYYTSLWDSGFEESAKTLIKTSPTFKTNLQAYEKEYSDTTYGKKAIKECATFKYF